MKTVGVLAFHGDVAEHLAILSLLKVPCMKVRSTEDLEECTHLIIPGGESTVIARFLQESGLDAVIRKRFNAGSLAVYGTCAGAILLARKASGLHAPATLGLMDFTIERNAYGSQMQSFDATLKIKGIPKKIEVSFIRAPRITRMGKEVDVLSYCKDDAVLVQEGRALAGTFHPELRGETAIHRLFLAL